MHPLRLKVNMTEAGGSGQEGGPPQSGGQMMFLLLMMVMMMMLVMNPDITTYSSAKLSNLNGIYPGFC
jgi:hypothetical protein